MNFGGKITTLYRSGINDIKIGFVIGLSLLQKKLNIRSFHLFQSNMTIGFRKTRLNRGRELYSYYIYNYSRKELKLFLTSFVLTGKTKVKHLQRPEWKKNLLILDPRRYKVRNSYIATILIVKGNCNIKGAIYNYILIAV